MIKGKNLALIIATCLIVVGIVIFVFAASINKWDMEKLSTNNYKSQTYTIVESFNDISINTSVSNITFELSDDSSCKLVCYEQENEKHTFKLENNTLSISQENTKKWYEYISISFKSPKLTIYLPQKEYNNLLINNSTGDITLSQELSFQNVDIKTSTGKVKVESISTQKLQINSSTGDTHLENIRCSAFKSNGSTGNCYLENLIANEEISITRSTGDIIFKKCDSESINVKTNTGDVSGTLCTGKFFTTKTSTGEIEIPQSTSGGKCHITTSTGDITIEISE